MANQAWIKYAEIFSEISRRIFKRFVLIAEYTAVRPFKAQNKDGRQRPVLKIVHEKRSKDACEEKSEED